MSTQRALLPGMALALGAGCAAGAFAVPSPWPVVAAAVLSLISLARRSPAWLWSAFLALGIALGAREPLSEALQRQLPLLREVRGTVASIPDRHRATYSFVLRVPSLGTKLLAYVPREAAVAPGDGVALSGTCEVPGGGWGGYLGRRGIHGVFWADDVELLTEGRPGAKRLLFRVREALLSALSRVLPEDARRLVGALLFGARGELDRELRERFRWAGVAHLLALSGLHLGIIAYGLWRLLGLLRLRPGRRYLVSCGVIALYIGLAGGRVSLVRAGVMFGFLGLFWALWEAGWVLRGWYDPLQGLSAAAIVVLCLWPWSALDLGFQLSFAATAGIVLGWPVWRDSAGRARLPRLLRPAGDLLWASICAQAATVGFVGSAFGYISPYGVLANLLLIPWTAVIIWTGLVLLALSPLGFAPALGAIAARYLVAPYLAAVRGISSLPGAVLPVGRYAGLWYAFAVLALVALWSWREEGRLV